MRAVLLSFTLLKSWGAEAAMGLEEEEDEEDGAGVEEEEEEVCVHSLLGC